MPENTNNSKRVNQARGYTRPNLPAQDIQRHRRPGETATQTTTRVTRERDKGGTIYRRQHRVATVKRAGGATATGLKMATGNRGIARVPKGYQHILMAEMIAVFVVIIIRSMADYVPNDDTSQPGKETPAKGANPIEMIAVTLVVYFLLSFLAARGGRAAQVSAAFGLLMLLGLLINSSSELSQLAGWAQNIGGNATQQPATATAGSSGGTGTSSADVFAPADYSIGALERAVDQFNNEDTGITARIEDLGKVGSDGVTVVLNGAQDGLKSAVNFFKGLF